MSTNREKSIEDHMKFLRSLSPYRSEQPHHHTLSRSPRPTSKSPRSPIISSAEQPQPPTITINTSQSHAYCPDIAGWPAPPANPSLRSDYKPHQMMTLNSSHTLLSPLLIKNCITTAVQTSPFHSPHHSPAPRGDFEFDGSSRFLSSMFKAVSSSNTESELRQKIQALEELAAEYERQKYNVLGSFSDYRERVAERERKLEADYSSKIIGLSEEVLEAKKDFQARMKNFEELFGREKESALQKLREEHQKEMEALEKRFSDSQLLNLEQKYMIEIRRLEEERKVLKAERERLNESFEMKLRRAQGLYETELAASKLLYSRELKALKDHENALKIELAARQEEFYDRLSELQLQSKQSKDEVNNCKNEVVQLEQKLTAKDREIQAISIELSIARLETNESLKKLSETKIDAEEFRREMVYKKEELERKIGQLNEADSTQNRVETTVREKLRSEVKALKNRIELLEMERDNLKSQSESQSQLHDSQVQALEAMLESTTKEKEGTAEHYEKIVERNRMLADEREYAMKREFAMKLAELEGQYNALREHIDQSDEHNSNIKLWEEIENLRLEKKSLEDELSELRKQIQTAQEKVKEYEDCSKNSANFIRLTLGKMAKHECENEKMFDEHITFSEFVEKLKDLACSIVKIANQENATCAKVEQFVQDTDESVFDMIKQNNDKVLKQKSDEYEQIIAEYQNKVLEYEELLKLSGFDEAAFSERLRQEVEIAKREWRREKTELEIKVEQLQHQQTTMQCDQKNEVAVNDDEAKQLLREKLNEKYAAEVEEKIAELNEEHAKTIEEMQKKHGGLTKEIEKLELRLKGAGKKAAEVERRDGQAQTDPLDFAAESSSLFLRCLTPVSAGKETRSLSIATTSDHQHLTMCQKVAANARFPSIVNDMDRKQRERGGKSAQNATETINSASSKQPKDKYAQEPWTSSLTNCSNRDGSFLNRQNREISYKLNKLDAPSSVSPHDSSSPSSSVHRGSSSGLLSPPPIDMPSHHRNQPRISPSRQMFYKGTFDKRPAWKF